MNRLDFLNKVDKTFSEATKEHSKVTSLLEVIPDIDYKDVSIHSAYADGCVTVEVETRSDVSKFVKLFPPVDVVLVRHGTVSIEPKQRIRESDRESAQDIFPIHFQLQAWTRLETKREFRWYTRCPWSGNPNWGTLVEVRVSIKDDPAGYNENHSRDRQGNITKYSWLPRSLPGDETIVYSNSHAPATPNTVISYWGGHRSLAEVLNLL